MVLLFSFSDETVYHIPINGGLFKEKTETSTNFTLLVFLQYFYFHLPFKCIRKSGFPKKFFQKSIVFYFTERFPKAKVVYLFLFPANSGATRRLFYQWSIEIPKFVDYLIQMSIISYKLSYIVFPKQREEFTEFARINAFL